MCVVIKFKDGKQTVGVRNKPLARRRPFRTSEDNKEVVPAATLRVDRWMVSLPSGLWYASFAFIKSVSSTAVNIRKQDSSDLTPKIFFWGRFAC